MVLGDPAPVRNRDGDIPRRLGEGLAGPPRGLPADATRQRRNVRGPTLRRPVRVGRFSVTPGALAGRMRPRCSRDAA